MDKIKIIDLLRSENKRANEIDLEVMANAILIYTEASNNIAKNGSIVLHPRTGSPIENPYLKVQYQQSSILLKYRHIKSNSAMQYFRKDN